MLKKKTFDKKLFLKKYFQDDKALEEKLKGIVVRAKVDTNKATVEYLPVKELEYFINVWNCHARLGKRKHTGLGTMTNTTIELKTKKAESLFKTLIDKRDVIINRSGHYYIQTDEQKEILDKILRIEGLR